MADEVKGREHLVRRQQVLTAVFKRFQPHFKNAFAPAQWPSLLEAWMLELRGIDTDVLERAASDVLSAAPQYPPKVWDLARAARKYQTPQQLFDAPTHTERLQVWLWGPPIAPRIVRVERSDTGQWRWPGMSKEDGAMFFDLDDKGKIEYCDAMVTNYQFEMASKGEAPLVV